LSLLACGAALFAAVPLIGGSDGVVRSQPDSYVDARNPKKDPGTSAKQLASERAAPKKAEPTEKPATKPTDAKPEESAKENPRKKGEPSPAIKKGEAQFDADDLEHTTKWANSWGMELVKNVDNGIRFRADLERFDKDMKTHVGKKIHWRLQVVSISEDFVTLQSQSGGHTERNVPDPRIGYRGGVLRFSSADRDFGFGLRVGSGISKEKAGQLNPGSMVLVTGITESISLERREDIEGNPKQIRFLDGIEIRIVLSDLHSE